MDIRHFIPNGVGSPEQEPMQYYGLIGDYVGGLWGTIIGAITLIVIFMSWRSSRRLDHKTKVYQVFAELLRTHEEIISSMVLNRRKGREAFRSILSEFNFIYRATRALVPDDAEWSIRQRIDIAYTFMYYGTLLQTQKVLHSYDSARLKLISDRISRERAKNEQEKKSPKRTFEGHQNRLSHYFRNLFTAYKYIDASPLSRSEKRILGKVLRAKLSNYEQALLALNIICHLGQEWERSGLLSAYRPIKNVPQNFFSFDENFNLKKEFPRIDFEWESQ